MIPRRSISLFSARFLPPRMRAIRMNMFHDRPASAESCGACANRGARTLSCARCACGGSIRSWAPIVHEPYAPEVCSRRVALCCFLSSTTPWLVDSKFNLHVRAVACAAGGASMFRRAGGARRPCHTRYTHGPVELNKHVWTNQRMGGSA